MSSSQQTEKRLIGVVVPVGSLRSSQSTGVGEFLDLVEFAGLCAKTGIGLIQLLPVNDTGYESSPYSALTAFGLHPLYLRIKDLSELEGAAKSSSIIKKIDAMAAEFEKETRFPFGRVLRAKMALLREIYAQHQEEIAKKAKTGGPLAAWIKANPWVKEYAVYRQLKEANEEKSWKDWASYSQPASAEIESLWKDEKLRKEHLFWVWLQEALDAQFSKAAKGIAKAGVLLEGDLPILINEDSCDVWAHPEYFHQDLSAGAPPDMYSPSGQNWGFPIYNWEAQKKDDYSWWRSRLKTAEKYYQAYRIDHVLGFFRIWASSRRDTGAALGRYIPYVPVKRKDLTALGFDKGRIRWMSEPHVPTGEVWDAMREIRDEWGNQDSTAGAQIAERIFSHVLERIGNEELWLFKSNIKGEKDIDAMDFPPAARNFLCWAWQNRLFLECEKDSFVPSWYFRESRAYSSLSQEEKTAMEALLEKRREESEKIWETQGKDLLSLLIASSSMLPCAEDLGAVPGCVPKVLTKLKILGLRVIRWFRAWDTEGQPYIPFEDYPELSVCTPAVHDSSTAREWWEREADQETFCNFMGVPSLPKVYNPGNARIILNKAAGAASRFRVFQAQDLLHLSPKWYAEDPASERINVPGTANDFNWTYRLPASAAELEKDTDLIQSLKDLCAVQPLPGKKAKPKAEKK